MTQHVNASQSDIMYKDWRLERPFLHGFVSALSLNAIPLYPEKYNKAHQLDPAPVPEGMIQYLKSHFKFANYLGVFAGGLVWLFILICIFSRYWLFTQNSKVSN